MARTIDVMTRFDTIKQKIWHDIGIDLGTANTLLFVRGRGIVINEPSVVAYQKKTNQIVAIGESAKQMIGKTPSTVGVKRPLVDGVVSDYEVTEQMLKYFLDKVNEKHPVLIKRPRVIIGLPSGVTEVEKRAVEEAAKSAGAREIHLIEEPIAAAIGSNLPVRETNGSMLVDIGGGTTEVAVMSLGGIVLSKSLRIAGDELNEAIIQFLRDEYKLQIGEVTAERIKTTIGTVTEYNKPKKITVRGRNVINGLPHEIEISSVHIQPILRRQVKPIIDAVRTAVEESPPELIADVMERSIVLAGGGALLHGLPELIADETKMKVTVSRSALTAVVEGCGLMLDSIGELRDILITTEVPT